MENEALYPFGFGLTYGKVAVRSADVDVSAVKEAAKAADAASVEKAEALVTVVLKNESNVDIEEIVQIYIKDTESALAVRNHSLCAFKRTALKAGEEVKVTLPVSGKAFMEYNEEGKRILDSGKFTLYAGVSQPDPVSVSLGGVTPVALNVSI